MVGESRALRQPLQGGASQPRSGHTAQQRTGPFPALSRNPAEGEAASRKPQLRPQATETIPDGEAVSLGADC